MEGQAAGAERAETQEGFDNPFHFSTWGGDACRSWRWPALAPAARSQEAMMGDIHFQRIYVQGLRLKVNYHGQPLITRSHTVKFWALVKYIHAYIHITQ